MHPHGQGVYEVLTRQSAAVFSPPPNAALQPEHHIMFGELFLAQRRGFSLRTKIPRPLMRGTGYHFRKLTHFT